MTEQPKVPPQGVSGPQGRELGGSDRDERRMVAAAVRLLMRLPRAARWGLLALALAGAGDLSGLDDVLLRALLEPAPVELRDERPSRAERPDLRLERADQEALDVR